MKYLNLLHAAAVTAMPLTGNAGEPLAAFDVTEGISRVFFAAAACDDGMSACGNAFVTQGCTYPADTPDGGLDGTLPNGDPAFPHLVIGEWTCEGYFFGHAIRTGTAPSSLPGRFIASMTPVC